MPDASNLGHLRSTDWKRLNDAADRFETACRSGDPLNWDKFLPPHGDPLRATVLRELIKTDLEIGWRRGRGRGWRTIRRTSPSWPARCPPP